MNEQLSNVDDIVSMLDSMMGKGHGHVNVSVDPEARDKVVETLGCSDCARRDVVYPKASHDDNGLDGEE